ncbi:MULTISPECIES: response regulator [unclassified Mesobacillus]|uniref:response regulator n=1 Tax=unclassified Mesobacillus TaxID=2675270 RepID=UPI00204188ED|nr:MULTISPECIES: response regulator [unclassified Mesobacillus]MCM3123879.1 response regulator [Mesobacillus sp. MER 33]MCM3234106.1 response regulator [Mesobacillus sp. MER 48]
MVKILIVDDEPLVRIGLKSSYDWEGNGYEIAGEAEDGEKALKMIEDIKPDIVILDIKMPKKDGLQVLEELQQKKIETYVIVLSSFDDLDHVKRAMKLGAKDYFHKPTMNGSLIVEALNQVKEEKASAKAGFNQDTKTKSAALYNLLHGSLDIDPSLLAVKERNLTVLVMKVRNIAQVLNRYSNDERTFFKTSFMNLMKEIISKEKETEFIPVDEGEYVLLISQSKSHSAQEIQEKVNNLVSFTINSIKRLMNIDLLIGLSEQISSLSEIKKAYTDAKSALNHAFYEPDKMAFQYQKGIESGEEACLEEANSFISRLKGLINEGSRKEFLEVLPKWDHFIRETRCLNEDDLKKIYKGFLFIMMNEETEYLQAEKEVDKIISYHHLSAYLMKKVGAESKSEVNFSPLTKNILNYINANYQQDISLKQLAEEFYVSPNYISKLFNKEMGRGLLDYVNEVRVSKAKQLLKEYQYKIYEVAEMVGFNSQVHFNIVFNKYVGMSPKEYRKSSL